jgi:hypothetical protein
MRNSVDFFNYLPDSLTLANVVDFVHSRSVNFVYSHSRCGKTRDLTRDALILQFRMTTKIDQYAKFVCG